MNNPITSPVPLEVALFFVQKLPLSYQKAIFEWLSTNDNIKKVENNQNKEKRIPLKFGAGKHLITFVADDFDEPLEDFEEYM
jgi:hypothetical protein